LDLSNNRLASKSEIPHTQKEMKSINEFTSRRERWQAAPEATYREGEYIDKLSKNKTAVVVKLIDGEEVRGWIEYYDKDIIRITRSTEPNLFIYKNRVKYLFEDPDVRRPRS
jgi:host factor-I protein